MSAGLLAFGAWLEGEGEGEPERERSRRCPRRTDAAAAFRKHLSLRVPLQFLHLPALARPMELHVVVSHHHWLLISFPRATSHRQCVSLYKPAFFPIVLVFLDS